MSQVSIFGYMVGGAFLSLAYYDYFYYVVAALVATQRIVMLRLKAEAAPGLADQSRGHESGGRHRTWNSPCTHLTRLPLHCRCAAMVRRRGRGWLESIERSVSLLSRHGQNAKLTALLFHKVPLAADPLTPTEPTFSQFEHILDFLQENATVLPLGDAASALARASCRRRRSR